jgi:DNA-binding transcriptional LysR family regulator
METSETGRPIFRSMVDRNSSMDWEDVRVFLAVSRAGSLRGAARALGVNHATVRRRLAQLEGRLDAALFARRPDGLDRTQAGDELLASAKDVEDALLAVQERVTGRESAPAGLVRISVPPAVMRSYLPRQLVEFCARYPEIELDVVQTDEFTRLGWREADLSLRMAFHVDDDVVGRRLLQYGKAVYAAPGYLEAAGAGVVWLGWSDEGPRPAWIRNTPFPEALVRHCLAGHMAQLEAARAGLGLTMLPCFLGDTEPGLVRVPGSEPQPDRSLWLLLHRALSQTARVRAFVDFLAEAVVRDRALFEGA